MPGNGFMVDFILRAGMFGSDRHDFFQSGAVSMARLAGSIREGVAMAKA